MAGATDYKITGNEALTGSASEFRVGSQPTVLKGTASQNKRVFDNYCDLIATAHNSLCDYVDSNQSAVVDNSVKQYYHDVLGWTADE